MTRRRRNSTRRWLLPLAVVAALGAAAWINRARIETFLLRGGQSTVRASGDHVDSGNEGRRVRVSGTLEAAGPARDADLGVSAKAVVLLRDVETYQWHEHCAGSDCSYAAAWSRQPVDSRGFRHPQGHENPPVRLRTARFGAPGIHLGAFSVPADLAAAQAKLVDFPVHVAELPPNLAASFSDYGGALYAGGDPAHPQVGAVRVRYRVVPIGKTELTGIQRGDALAAH